ncbi:hypothetical protein COO60DRAFT_393877 [Scenedesmus sp. NREL 46B-D3]|nr:hypothetical protein COO60DRAFT_393877 [Scenedesmus sp. NREL 46B-D3]
MIIDCPEWVAHRHAEGISAIDVHPNGRRLATCGTDPQIKIWNLLPVLDPAAEADPEVPKLLAALSEHQGSAHVVAFNHCGVLLASGGNDNTVLLYKLHSGVATSKLGASFVNIENWKTVANIRGHSLDVTGLAWSPSDRQLATCSMDGSIMVFNISADGQQHSPAHKLSGQHHGWVKGLAFDPLGRYLASQGRNGVKVWDASRDWALVTHQKTPFDRAPETAFKNRISWSPDGELLLAVNASSGGQPTTVLFKRQTWEATHLVGHRSSVVAAAANPRMFFAPRKLQAARRAAAERMLRQADGNGSDDGDEQQQEDAAAAAGGGSKEAFDDMPSMVCACSSNDKTFTVWSSELALPVLHCQQVHVGNIVDLAWTPDGYTLIACSNDDTVSVIRFSEAELGRAMSDEQLRALLEQEYGVAAAAATGANTAAAGPAAAAACLEDAELASIRLSAAAANAVAPTLADDKPAQAATAAAAAAPRRVAPQPVGVNPAAAGGGAAASSALDRRLMPTGTGVTTGSLQQPAAAAAAAANRKRAHPAGGGAAAAGPSAKRPAAGGGVLHQGQQQQQQQHALRAAASGPSAAGGSSSGWLLECPPVHSQLVCKLTEVHAAPSTQAAHQRPELLDVMLTVENHRPSSSGGAPGADVCVQMCAPHGSGRSGVVWCDKVQGEVVAIAGTAFFSAAATSSGLLHTWRPGGNLLLPPLALGCPAVRLQAQGDWGLLLLAADGELVLLDLQQSVRQMGAAPSPNIRPLLAASSPGTALADTWISGSTSSRQQVQQQRFVPCSHMAVLSDASGWMFHSGLGLWACLHPGLHDAAGQAPRPGGFAQAGGDADTERMRCSLAAAAQGCGAAAGVRLPQPSPGEGAWQRRQAQLELAKAQSLGGAADYERWLAVMVHVLAQQRDEARLKELAQDLLGPERWSPAQRGACRWAPSVLGLDKRELLQRLVLPVMAQHSLSIAGHIHRHLQAAQAYTQQQERNSSAAGVSPDLLRLVPQALPGAVSVPPSQQPVLRQQQQQQQQQHLAQLPGVQQQHQQQPDAGLGSMPPLQQQQPVAARAAGWPETAAVNPSVPAAASDGGGPTSTSPHITPTTVQDGQQQQQQQHARPEVGETADGPTGRKSLQENQTQQQVVPPNGRQHLTADKAAARSTSTGAEAAADGV